MLSCDSLRPFHLSLPGYDTGRGMTRTMASEHPTDASNDRDETAGSDIADGSNYRVEDEPGSETADGSNYREENVEGSEIADGSNYQVQDEPGPRSLTARTTATNRRPSS